MMNLEMLTKLIVDPMLCAGRMILTLVTSPGRESASLHVPRAARLAGFLLPSDLRGMH
jgi:hypothetical protein